MTRLRSRLTLVVCVVAGIGATAASPPAVASFGIRSFEASYTEAPLPGAEAEALGPPDFTAGSHPYQFTANFAFNTKLNAQSESVVEGYAKNLQIELPRGVIGDLSSITRCSQATFMEYYLSANSSKCPTASQIGVLEINGEEHPLFNLVPPAGEAGQIATVVLVVPIMIDFSIRNGSDYGLTAELHNLGQGIEAKKVSLILWGVPADPGHDAWRQRCKDQEIPAQDSCTAGVPLEPLLTMPTSCTETLTTTLVASSWEEPNVDAEKSATASDAGGMAGHLSGCERLPFNPSVTVQTESAAADTPTGLSVDVHVPYQGGAGELAEASLQNLVVTLPDGLSLNPPTAGGLVGCTSAEFAPGQAAKSSCPDAAKIGDLEIQTPVLTKPLSGFVYLAQPPEGEFEGNLGIYLVGEEEGIDFKLAGQLHAQPSNGQLTLTLDEVPELPLSELRLNLYGGPRGALANPPACATFTSTTELTPYSTAKTTARSSANDVDENCDGGFAPSFVAGATSSTAGQGTGFAIDASRSDGQQYLQNLTVTMPAGVMANISSVPQCGDSDAAAGTCPASSEIGTIAVASGAGPDPFYLNGRIYLTGPYGGAPFGISLVIPAMAGPFNLGTVLVRGGITIDLAASNMTIATDPFPSILRGIPLRIKSLELTIDRSGFMVNPTGCTERATDGTVGSTAGFDAPVSAPFGVSGCAGLLFAPKLAAATLANAGSRGKGASLNVKITDSASVHANLKSLSIKLPKALKPRMIAIQQACLQATFASNPQACPPASVVGNAAVDTPLLSAPLTGPVYLVFHRGTKYPDLVLLLHGDGLDLQLKGTVEITKGISTTTFSPLPDIAMSLFELNLPEGSHSLLGATESLCAKQRTMLDALDGQNGAKREGTVKTVVEGCSAGKGKAAKRGGAKAARRRRAKAAAGRPAADSKKWSGR
jgi:hypothetical protein